FAVGFGLFGSLCLYALQVFDDGGLPHGGVSYAVLGMLVGFYLSGAIYAFGLKRMLKSRPTEAAAETLAAETTGAESHGDPRAGPGPGGRRQRRPGAVRAAGGGRRPRPHRR